MSLSFKLYITSPSESLQQIRRVSLPSTVSWSTFLDTLTSLVHFPKFYVRYEDEEEDLVIINSQLEWTEALSILKKNTPIRLQITPDSCISLSSSNYNFLNDTPINEQMSMPVKEFSSNGDLLKTVIIPAPQEAEATRDERTDREFLVQSFHLLGLDEAQKQFGTPEKNPEHEVPDLSSSQPENEGQNVTENVSLPKRLNESNQLPVGFSPSFFENVTFVPQIFSGRFWLNDDRLSDNISKSSETQQTPNSLEKHSEPMVIEPSVTALQTNLEPVEAIVGTTPIETTPAVTTPIETTLEETENSQTLETQKSIKINQKWAKQVDDLLDMGFEFNQVIQVIQQENGNLERALEILLN